MSTTPLRASPLLYPSRRPHHPFTGRLHHCPLRRLHHHPSQGVSSNTVVTLENWIDAADAQLCTLHNFILSGGTPGSAALHVARTVCRRAERHVLPLLLAGHTQGDEGGSSQGEEVLGMGIASCSGFIVECWLLITTAYCLLLTTHCLLRTTYHFLSRLSDFLFVAARLDALSAGASEQR